jgi:transposase InsO family protein
LPLLATHLSGKFSNSPAPTAASKSESLLEGITLLAHPQSKAAWALQKDSQARRMSKENSKWGASRIHGELLMLGFEVAQSTVSKYMVQDGPPTQSWKTFLRNHAQAIAAIDLCVVPTLTFERLFAFLVLGHGRRQLLWFEVTRHPTAEWLARQITEAFPWASAPAYLVRDNDRAYGHIFTSRVRAMGIRDRPISPGSPWQNAYMERLIGTVRRECLDRMLVFGEGHLRQILSVYAAYYNEVRTHLALDKDAPLGRAVQRTGVIVAIPILSGLHHHYVRI